MKNEIELQPVLHFWFEELSARDWFSGSVKLDEKITERFADVHHAVAGNEYWKYRTSGESLLAEVIVLDQFSRNMFRGSAEAFAHDGHSLALAQQAIAAGYDNDLSDAQRQFLYMPFMHSESQVIHAQALILFESLGNSEALKFEKTHKGNSLSLKKISTQKTGQLG